MAISVQTVMATPTPRLTTTTAESGAARFVDKIITDMVCVFWMHTVMVAISTTTAIDPVSRRRFLLLAVLFMRLTAISMLAIGSAPGVQKSLSNKFLKSFGRSASNSNSPAVAGWKKLSFVACKACPFSPNLDRALPVPVDLRL